MFNNRLKNLFLVLFLLISLTLTFGCSSKPSEEEMKNTISKMLIKGHNLKYNWEAFKITNSFSKKIDNKEWYFIEANCKFTFESDINGKHYKSEVPVIITKGRFNFTKQGNEWIGGRGWKE